MSDTRARSPSGSRTRVPHNGNPDKRDGLNRQLPDMARHGKYHEAQRSLRWMESSCLRPRPEQSRFRSQHSAVFGQSSFHRERLFARLR